MSYSTNSAEYKSAQADLKRSADWDDKRKRALWEIRKNASGIVSANLNSSNVKGTDRASLVAVIAELVTDGTILPRSGYHDWKSTLLAGPCVIKHLGVMFALGEESQQELQLDVTVALPEPPARKERGHLTDLEMFEAAPSPTEHEPDGYPLLTLRLAYWKLWRSLYEIDSRLARQYRGAMAPDHIKLAQLVNGIIFGVSSDKPEITPARAPRIERAQAYLARYVAHLRTQVDWEKVGLGDLS